MVVANRSLKFKQIFQIFIIAGFHMTSSKFKLKNYGSQLESFAPLAATHSSFVMFNSMYS